MHELSLAAGIHKLVEDTLARESGRVRVTRLVIEVGALAGVEIRALRFALDSLAPGSALAEAEQCIEEIPGAAWCLRCAHTVPIAARGDACPDCGSHGLMPTAGTDLKVRELIVVDVEENV